MLATTAEKTITTDHVEIGLVGYKVVDIQHITRTEDSCSQRHEAVGFERMYADFEQHGITVAHQSPYSWS